MVCEGCPKIQEWTAWRQLEEKTDMQINTEQVMSTVLEGCARSYARTKEAIEWRVMRKYQELS